MYSYIVFLLLFSQLVNSFTVGERNETYFRNDYVFLEKTQSFYKLRDTPLTWLEAKNYCALENAELFYPVDKFELDAVAELWDEAKIGNKWILTGIVANFLPKYYDTITGIPMESIYTNWDKGEPNSEQEDIVELNLSTGLQNDLNKKTAKPYICKKALAAINWRNTCNNNVTCEENASSEKSTGVNQELNIVSPDSNQCCLEGFTYNKYTGSCYKFVFTPKTWREAYLYCRSDHSVLAIINSQLEASALTAIVKNAALDLVKPADYTPGSVHLGFYKIDQEGWSTLKGKSLEASGYADFAYDTSLSGENELQCGAMFYNAELRNIGCNETCFFICEHDFSQ